MINHGFPFGDSDPHSLSSDRKMTKPLPIEAAAAIENAFFLLANFADVSVFRPTIDLAVRFF
jgi:hypothetical protein